MEPDQNTEQREVQHGQKMIELRVRFWTDDIAEEGRVVPKNAWSSGVVRMQRNDGHGITPGDPVHFNSLGELSAAVEQVLIDHGIRLHPSRRTQRYMPE